MEKLNAQDAGFLKIESGQPVPSENSIVGLMSQLTQKQSMRRHECNDDEALQPGATQRYCQVLHVQQSGAVENPCSKISESGMCDSNQNSREESPSNAAR